MPDLRARFAELDELVAPDLWGDIVERGTVSVPASGLRVGGTSRRSEASAPRTAMVLGAAVLLLGLVVAALLAGRNRPTGLEVLPEYGFTTAYEGLSIDKGGGILLSRFGTGTFRITRYHPEGFMDTNFGANGTLVVPGTWGYPALAIARDRDTWLTVGNTGDGAFQVTRLSSDGEVDPTFGNAGRSTSRLLPEPATVLARADGSILVIGTSTGVHGVMGSLLIPRPSMFVVVALTSRGDLDEAFGVAGMVSVDVAPGDDTAFTAVLVPDGGILVAGRTGYMTPGPFDNDAVVMRLDEAGRRLSPWAGNSTVRAHVKDTFANTTESIAVAPDGRVAVVVQPSGAVAMFDPDGGLDAGFGDQGWLDVDPPLAEVAFQPDGKLIVAETRGITRYDETGTLDTSFGVGGSASYP